MSCCDLCENCKHMRPNFINGGDCIILDRTCPTNWKKCKHYEHDENAISRINIYVKRQKEISKERLKRG